MASPTSVPEFYAGQKLLVTGALGFMGKVLIEKILRCCPDVDKIYILVRAKRGKQPQERWEDAYKVECFDRLRKENPDAYKKVIPLEGDVSSLNLGLSPESEQRLIDEVTMVFNVAASVQFIDNFDQALKTNTRGTRELAELAKKMKHLKCFVHVSTAYSSVEKSAFNIGEQLYTPLFSWKPLLQVLDQEPEALMNLTEKFLGGHPNTYTLTKSLAEQVVKDYSQYFPVVIARPSVVMNSLKEPIEGWVDSFAGPAIISMLVGLGILRIQFCEGEGRTDYVAVDYATNGFLVSAWDICQKKVQSGVEVYNCCFGDYISVTNFDLRSNGLKVARNKPFDRAIWYPFVIFTSNPFVYNFLFFFLQLFPAIFLDTLARIMGQKPRMVKICMKVLNVHKMYSFFSTKTFIFPNEKFTNLEKKLSPEDRKVFYTDVSTEWTSDNFYNLSLEGSRKYLKMDINPNTPVHVNLRKIRIFMVLHYTLCFMLLIGAYFVFQAMVKKVFSTGQSLFVSH